MAASKRRKIKVTARELSDVDVNFVSLVRHAATRIPFRITKSEKPKMHLNLNKLFLKNETPEEPVVVGIILEKGVDAIAMQALLLKEGYEFPVTVTGDKDSVLLKADDEELPEDVQICKLNDHVAVAVEKSIRAWTDSTLFSENIVTAGFFPGLHMATDTLINTIYNISGADNTSKPETADAVKAALKAYTSYVMDLLKALPESVFKAEKLVVPMLAAAAEGGAGTADAVVEKNDGESGEGETQGAAGTDSDGTPIEKSEVSDKDNSLEGDLKVDKADGEAGEQDTNAGSSASAESAEGDGETDILKSLGTQLAAVTATLKEQEGVSKVVKGLKETLEGLETKVVEFGKQADAAQKLAAKATEAISGTVVTGDSQTTVEKTEPVQTKKTEEDPDFWDSAFDFNQS